MGEQAVDQLVGGDGPRGHADDRTDHHRLAGRNGKAQHRHQHDRKAKAREKYGKVA